MGYGAGPGQQQVNVNLSLNCRSDLLGPAFKQFLFLAPYTAVSRRILKMVLNFWNIVQKSLLFSNLFQFSLFIWIVWMRMSFFCMDAYVFFLNKDWRCCHMVQRNQEHSCLCTHILRNCFDVFRRHKRPMQWRHNRLQHHSLHRYTNIRRRPQQQQQHSMRRQNQRSFHSPRRGKPYSHHHPLLTTRGHHQSDMKWRHQVCIYFSIPQQSCKEYFSKLLT